MVLSAIYTPATSGAPIAIQNASFEDPPLLDYMAPDNSTVIFSLRDGVWISDSAAVTIGDSHPDFGEPLRIEFRRLTSDQLNIDLVELNAVAVPEPSTLCLAAISGLFAICLSSRSRFRSLHRCGMMVVIVGGIPFVSAAECRAMPVQWNLSDGGNGHAYLHVLPPSGITWTDAKIAAEGTSYLGVPGHLVAINDQDEWDFIINEFPIDWTWIGLTDEEQEGDFRWVTDEPVTFTRWIPGEPNNAGNEDHVFYQISSGLGGDFGWNDFHNFNNVYTSLLPIGYIVEYAVPEPSGLLMAGIGASFLAFAACMRRRRSRRT